MLEPFHEKKRQADTRLGMDRFPIEELVGRYVPWFLLLVCLSALLWSKFLVLRNVPHNKLQPLLADSVKGVCFAYGVCEMQGLRPYMEDRHMAAGNLKGNPKNSLYAVFDGHGGSAAAQYCTEHLEENILSSPSFPHTPSQALVDGM